MPQILFYSILSQTIWQKYKKFLNPMSKNNSFIFDVCKSALALLSFFRSLSYQTSLIRSWSVCGYVPAFVCVLVCHFLTMFTICLAYRLIRCSCMELTQVLETRVRVRVYVLGGWQDGFVHHAVRCNNLSPQSITKHKPLSCLRLILEWAASWRKPYVKILLLMQHKNILTFWKDNMFPHKCVSRLA